jgi:glycosyltransferase involved in cell wall biosynthesis
MPPSPKIAFTLHVLGQGGTDRVCCLLASGFVRAGYDVELLVFCDGGAGEKSLMPLLDDSVNISHLGASTGSRTADLIRLLPSCARWLKSNRPDCVISTGNNMNWVSASAVKMSGAKDTMLALKTTNPVIRPHKSTRSNWFRKFGYAHAFSVADKVLTLSDAETRELRQQFPRVGPKFETVINPYVTPKMLDGADDKDAKSDGRIILGVGRFGPQKRLDLLVKAFARLKDEDAQLVLLGNGPERDELEQLVRHLGVEDRVRMPGFVADVGPWFAAASVFVLTSRYEGLPAVVLEAMAYNCPVLSTDCFVAARELIGGAEGCAIMESTDPGDVASIIDSALAQIRPTRLRAIAESYSVEHAIKSHIDSISSLID